MSALPSASVLKSKFVSVAAQQNVGATIGNQHIASRTAVDTVIPKAAVQPRRHRARDVRCPNHRNRVIAGRAVDELP